MSNQSHHVDGHSSQASPVGDRFYYFVLALFTLLAAILRLAWLGNYPGGFSQDEAVAGYDAWCLLLTGRDHHGDWFPWNPRMFGDYPTGVATYLTIPAVALLGPTVLAVRIVCALLNVFAVPLFGLLATRLFRDRAAGLFAAALLAVSPWNLFLSRWAIAPGFITFFLVAAMLALYRVLGSADREDVRFLPAAGSAVLVFLWTQIYAAQYFFAPFMALLAAILWWRPGNRRRILMGVGVYTVLMLAAIHVRVNNPAAAGRFYHSTVVFDHDAPAQIFLRYKEYLSNVFLFRAPNMDVMQQLPHVAHINHYVEPFYYMGLMGLAAMLLAPGKFLKIMRLASQPDDAAEARHAAVWVLMGLLLAPVAGSLFRVQMYTSRVVQLLVVVLLITALGCSMVWRLLRRVPVRWAAPAFVAVVMAYLCEQTVKTAEAFIRSNPECKMYNDYGLPEVMRYLAAQPVVRHAAFSKIQEAYIYHLLFTPVHPRRLLYSDVNPKQSKDPYHWNFTDVDHVGEYYFNERIQWDRVVMKTTFRHAVRDEDGEWFEIYERGGDWFVLSCSPPH